MRASFEPALKNADKDENEKEEWDYAPYDQIADPAEVKGQAEE
ncbi:hypothetical protein [Terracidiphilus gabretensis]|nr:hypothetical protein [Terracidiphilus gabretensis]